MKTSPAGSGAATRRGKLFSWYYIPVLISPSPALRERRGGLWRGCRGAGEAGLKVPWCDGDVSLSIFKLEWAWWWYYSVGI